MLHFDAGQATEGNGNVTASTSTADTEQAGPEQGVPPPILGLDDGYEADDNMAEDLIPEGAVSEEEEVEAPQPEPLLGVPAADTHAEDPDAVEVSSDVDEGSADPDNVSSEDTEEYSETDPEPASEFSDSGDEDDQFFDALPAQPPVAALAANDPIPEQHRGVIYNPKLHQPLYEYAKMTVIQAVFALVSSKIKNNMSDTAFDDMLRLQKAFAPQPNHYPSSFFVCKSILGVKPVREVEWHTCGCQESAWDPKGPSSPEDACPFCHERRYIRNMRGKLIPAQVCISL